MAKELTNTECMEIFKKYDPLSYQHYSENGAFFGSTARSYAKYLQEQHYQDKAMEKEETFSEEVGAEIEMDV